MSGNRWLADPVQGTADRGGNSTRHPGQVERSPTGDLARDEALPLEVKAEQRPQVGSPVHPDSRSTLVQNQIVTSRRGVKQHRQVESAVADVAAPVAGGRVRPIHDAGESVVTPQHIEVLVVAVDQDLFVTKRPRGSLAGCVVASWPSQDCISAGVRSGCPVRADVSVHRTPVSAPSSSIARSWGAGTPCPRIAASAEASRVTKPSVQSSPGQRRSTTSLSPVGESTVIRSMSAVIPPGKGATAVTRARA